MALYTDVKTLPGCCFLIGVAAFGDLLYDIFMAGRAFLGFKKIR